MSFISDLCVNYALLRWLHFFFLSKSAAVVMWVLFHSSQRALTILFRSPGFQCWTQASIMLGRVLLLSAVSGQFLPHCRILSAVYLCLASHCITCITTDYRFLLTYSTKNEGNVYVKRGSEWGLVCDDGWSKENGNVVCKQLGYTGAKKVTSYNDFKSPSSCM